MAKWDQKQNGNVTNAPDCAQTSAEEAYQVSGDIIKLFARVNLT